MGELTVDKDGNIELVGTQWRGNWWNLGHFLRPVPDDLTVTNQPKKMLNEIYQ
jgi:hypothetical protein